MSNWTVKPSNRVKKQIKELAKWIQNVVYKLFSDLERFGPKQPQWPNYKSLNKQRKVIPPEAHHCHLKKGNPTYVACWRVLDKNKKEIEVFYVGTHENAPYQ